jgi:hypothetical protein
MLYNSVITQLGFVCFKTNNCSLKSVLQLQSCIKSSDYSSVAFYIRYKSGINEIRSSRRKIRNLYTFHMKHISRKENSYQLPSGNLIFKHTCYLFFQYQDSDAIIKILQQISGVYNIQIVTTSASPIRTV